MEQKYDFKQIPSGWRYCFNAQCPMKDQCLRFQTALALPDSYEWGEAVFPGALKRMRRCCWPPASSVRTSHE